MPYSYPNNIPTFAKNKKADLQKRVIQLFNETLSRTNSEESARRAALAFMTNYEKKYGSADVNRSDKGDATDKRIKKSVEEAVEQILKSKYLNNLDKSE